MCVLLAVTASASVCSPLSLAIRVLCLEEVCQSVSCLVSLCLCVWLLGLFLFNSVPVWIRMCLCVLSPCLFVRLLVALVLCRVGLLVMFPVQVGMVWPLLRLLCTLPPLAVGTP